jgi:hypothetical protein
MAETFLAEPDPVEPDRAEPAKRTRRAHQPM